jgi:hypothetical protein
MKAAQLWFDQVWFHEAPVGSHRSEGFAGSYRVTEGDASPHTLLLL